MKKTSLQRVLIFPFVILVICLAATFGGVSYWSGVNAADELSKQVLVDMIDRINKATERHLLGSQIALKAVAPDPIPANKNRTSTTIINFSETLSQLEERLWVATGFFPQVNRYVYFAGDDGSFIGINRLPDMVELRVREPGEQKRSFYSMEGPGQRIALTLKQRYEAKERPWYIAALKAGKEAWSPVYTDFTTLEPTITLSRPIYKENQTLIGVVATDMPLTQLTDFFKTLKVSKNGVAFIIERSGAIIATSAPNELPYKIENKKLVRLMAKESASPLVQETYQQIANWLKTANNTDQPYTQTFHGSQGKIQFATAILNQSGIDWITVVAVPRSDFLGHVTYDLYRNLAIGLVAAIIALLLGSFILQLVVRDIQMLTHAAKDIGDGLPLKLKINRSDEIGQLAQSLVEMERDLRTDKLTHVLNRESLITQIEFRRRNASAAMPLSFALLFIDLDRFKEVNDILGHDAGDRVLIEVANRIKNALRADDSLARFGGDEFVIYLHGASNESMVNAASEKIRLALLAPIEELERNNMSIGASIGASFYPADGQDVDTLFKVADMRMFEAKRASSHRTGNNRPTN